MIDPLACHIGCHCLGEVVRDSEVAVVKQSVHFS